MKQERRIGRNATVLVAGEIVAKVASLALFAVMARQLGQDEFGEFAFALALVVLVVTISSFGLDAMVPRGVARDPEDMRALMWDAIALKVALGVVAILVGMLIVTLGDYEGGTELLLVILGVATLIESIGTTVGNVLQGLEDMAPIALAAIAQRFTTAVLAITAMLLGEGTVAVSIFYLLGAVVALVYLSVALVRRDLRLRPTLVLTRARALLVASIPVGTAVIFTTLLWKVDTTILAFMKGSSAVGLYSAAYRLLDSTLFISFFFVAALFPVLSRLRRDTKPPISRAYELGMKGLMAALLPLGVAFGLFAEPILRLVYGEPFTAGTLTLRILGGAAVTYGICYLGSFLLTAQDRQRILPWTVGTALVLNVILNLILIPPYSYDGAAAATTISEVVYALLTMYFAIRATGAISARRILIGPLAGCAAMFVVAAVVGLNLVGLAVAALVYPAVLLLVERRLYPRDVALGFTALRRTEQTIPVDGGELGGVEPPVTDSA